MWDNLIAEDPKLRKWLDESRLEGRADGIAAMQGTVLDTLNRRFPHLVDEIKPEVEAITSLDGLRQLNAEIAVAQDEATARRVVKAHMS